MLDRKPTNQVKTNQLKSRPQQSLKHENRKLLTLFRLKLNNASTTKIHCLLVFKRCGYLLLFYWCVLYLSRKQIYGGGLHNLSSQMMFFFIYRQSKTFFCNPLRTQTSGLKPRKHTWKKIRVTNSWLLHKNFPFRSGRDIRFLYRQSNF